MNRVMRKLCLFVSRVNKLSFDTKEVTLWQLNETAEFFLWKVKRVTFTSAASSVPASSSTLGHHFPWPPLLFGVQMLLQSEIEVFEVCVVLSLRRQAFVCCPSGARDTFHWKKYKISVYPLVSWRQMKANELCQLLSNVPEPSAEPFLSGERRTRLSWFLN